jgi:hypothetical protein
MSFLALMLCERIFDTTQLLFLPDAVWALNSVVSASLTDVIDNGRL